MSLGGFDHYISVRDMHRVINRDSKGKYSIHSCYIVESQAPQIHRSCDVKYDEKDYKYYEKSRFHIECDQEDYQCHSR